MMILTQPPPSFLHNVIFFCRLFILHSSLSHYAHTSQHGLPWIKSSTSSTTLLGHHEQGAGQEPGHHEKGAGQEPGHHEQAEGQKPGHHEPRGHGEEIGS